MSLGIAHAPLSPSQPPPPTDPLGNQGGGGDNTIWDQLRQWLSSLVGDFGDLGDLDTDTLTQALPFLQVYQQMAQAQYQSQYLDYLGKQQQLGEDQLAEAQQELDFKNGPYWDWYTKVYYPQQQELSQLNFDTQKQLSADQLKMGEQQLQIGNQNVYQELQRSKQADASTAVALAQAFQAMPFLRTEKTADGRKVSGLAYSYGYPQ
jgi:hypothetical protein